MKEKVLYCGMADDILTPLILVPNLSKLFAIDLFDKAYAKNNTWNGQKDDILQCLIKGNNKNSHHREIYLHYNKNTKIYDINEPCLIINEKDNDKCWIVDFTYKGIQRQLVYFHHTNFIANWDKQINGISHLMCMGAEFPMRETLLNKMIRERCISNCKFYDQFAVFKNTIKTKTIGQDVFINDLQNVLC